MTQRDQARKQISIARLALMAGLSVSVLTGSAFVPTIGEASAQSHFNQRQIIQKLRLPRGQKVRRNQGGGPVVVKRRAPQSNAPVVLRRAPQSHNGGQVVVKRRAPQAGGNNVPVIRAPQPQGPVVLRRAPQPQGGGVVKFRAPQPQGGGVAEFRAPPPTAKSRAPSPSNGPVVKRRAPAPQNTQVVSNGPVAPSNNQRGLGVQQGFVQEAGFAPENYPEQGRLDLEILFDYDSDQINPKSVRQLIELGDALNDPELGAGRFMIAGHTDASGSNFYNADLSRRRAQAVTRFLVEFAGVSPERLDVEGFGEEYLKYPDAPDSGQNRRVEIINLGEAS